MRGLAEWLVGGLALLCVALTLLPLIRTDNWFVRLWDFPRLQLLVLMIGLLIAWVALGPVRGWGGWALAGALVIACIWQATYAAAYLPVGPREVRSARKCAPGQSVTLLNINVLQDNRDFAKTLELVRRTDADIVLFLETDQGWADALKPLASDYPHVASAPLGNTYGMILMSRLPMTAEVRYRVKGDIPSIDAEVTMKSDATFLLHALHPEPPRPGDDTGARDVELVVAGREVREHGRAALVLGDLNDVAWSATSKLFRKVSGTLDPRAGRGLYPTFNAKYPLFQWPLDHMFVTPHWEIEEINRMAKVGSDHYPIFYRTCLARPAEQRVTAPTPPPDARREAREEVRDGLSEVPGGDGG